MGVRGQRPDFPPDPGESGRWHVTGYPLTRRTEVSSIELDLGDIVISVTARVKNIVQPNKIVWHIGPPRTVTDAERHNVHVSPITPHPSGKVDLYMDLLDNNKVKLSIGWTDEVGNPADAPASFTATYGVDNAAALSLTDNGDGTAEVAATGTLDSGTVHVDVDWTDSDGAHNASGDLLITVVGSMADRINITPGTPEHF